MAHGAELVSYFRWRQFPHPQEQMHSGLLLPDRTDDVGAHEVRAAAADIARLGVLTPTARSVALIFSYEADWTIAAQPLGANFAYLDLAFAMYSALRRLGLNIDILAPGADLTGYAMIVVPTMPILDPALIDLTVPVLFGPRTGSKTELFAISENLPPGPLQKCLPICITRVESSRDEPRWREQIEATPEITERDGCYQKANVRYLSCWPDAEQLRTIFTSMADEAGLAVTSLPADLRVRRAGDLVFAFNYGPETLPLNPAHDYVLGGSTLQPTAVAAWHSPLLPG